MRKLNLIWEFLVNHRLFITIILSAMFVGFIGDDSVKKYISLQMHVRQLEMTLARETEQMEKDSIKLSNLLNNSDEYENVARERYFMKRDNEDIFIMSIDQ